MLNSLQVVYSTASITSQLASIIDIHFKDGSLLNLGLFFQGDFSYTLAIIFAVNISTFFFYNWCSSVASKLPFYGNVLLYHLFIL